VCQSVLAALHNQAAMLQGIRSFRCWPALAACGTSAAFEQLTLRNREATHEVHLFTCLPLRVQDEQTHGNSTAVDAMFVARSGAACGSWLQTLPAHYYQ
jgi:hypothetical protein